MYKLAVVLISVLATAKSTFWTWKSIEETDIDTHPPAGYSYTYEKNLWACRFQNSDHGFVIGVFYGSWFDTAGCFAVDIFRNVATSRDDRRIQVIMYPPGTVSWQRVPNPQYIDMLRPYLISAGGDISNGTQQQYFCRFWTENPNSHTQVLIVGRFIFSNPTTCFAAWNSVRIVESTKMELLTSNFYQKAKVGNEYLERSND